jgi:hypothetical protein
VLRFDVACGPVNLHWIAVIAALQQQDIAPKGSVAKFSVLNFF